MLVAGLLIEQLCFEQIGHSTGTGTIEITVQAQIFFSLLDATTGNAQLSVGLLHIVPSLLHTNLQQLCIVGKLRFGFLLLDLAALDGVEPPHQSEMGTLTVANTMPNV